VTVGLEAEVRRLPLELERLMEENGDLLHRLAAAYREIERLQARVTELTKQRRNISPS